MATATILHQGGGPATYIGRFGSDEFAHITAATDAEALPMAKRIRAAADR